MVSALYVVVTEDIMKFNIDNKKEMEQHNIMLFISHSSKDEHIVKLLVNLIKNAFPIPSDKIRCTSLAGYGLDIGAETINELRKEALEAKAFVAVLTRNALSSEFTMLEIGCRWGLGENKSFLPIVCDKQGIDILKGPIRYLNVAMANDTSSIHDFVHALENVLDVKAQKTSSYDKDVNRLASYIRKRPDNNLGNKDRSDNKERTKLEEYAIKSITSKFNLWLKQEDSKKENDEFRKKQEDIVNGEYSPWGVFQDIISLYAPLGYERVDKLFSIEREVREEYGLGIDNRRLQIIKNEAYAIARKYFNLSVDYANVEVQRHLAKYDIGEYKIKEVEERAERLKKSEINVAIEHINMKALELEAACGVSQIKRQNAEY